MEETQKPIQIPDQAGNTRLGHFLKWGILASTLLLSLAAFFLYDFYPRTDDAVVVANVVGIAPRVSGIITQVTVHDDQFVRAGDLLFEIDPTPYQHVLDRAAAQQKQAEDTLNRMEPLLKKVFVSTEEVDHARASKKVADAALATARYDLDGCRVTAPFDGYVANLNLSNGAYAHAAAEVLTLVDARNWYVIANFRESLLDGIEPGRQADIYIMTRKNVKYTGVVEGIGRGVEPEELSKMSGLPKVKRELNWVRLAQRFPVRIRLNADPSDLGPRLGASAIVTLTGHGSTN